MSRKVALRTINYHTLFEERLRKGGMLMKEKTKRKKEVAEESSHGKKGYTV